MALGLGVSSMMVGDVRGDLAASAPPVQSAMEKYELGQDPSAGAVPLRKTEQYTRRAPADTSAGTGMRNKNGARVLVPGEPAMKKVRMELEKGLDDGGAGTEFAGTGDIAEMQDETYIDGHIVTADGQWQNDARAGGEPRKPTQPRPVESALRAKPPLRTNETDSGNETPPAVTN